MEVVRHLASQSDIIKMVVQMLLVKQDGLTFISF